MDGLDNHTLPGAINRWFSLGENQVRELEEFASLARAYLSLNEEGHRVHKDCIEDQLKLVREGVRDHRISDITCWWLGTQKRYKNDLFCDPTIWRE